MQYLSLILIAATTFFSSCKKGGGTETNVAPANLTLNAVVSTDNSGNVSFTASATNAVSYDYDFGNGNYQTVTSG
ncbi:MAG: beta-glucanase precursor, partial [Bacteroidetes bacterium]|nr:beta-glucanase precursor [Bacteroidota bacterium]